jgi:hypothetical protein
MSTVKWKRNGNAIIAFSANLEKVYEKVENCILGQI